MISRIPAIAWLPMAVARGFLCLVWLLSVIAKLSTMGQMADVIRSILPFLGKASMVFAVLILLGESTSFILLLFRRTLNLAAILSMVLGTIFVGVNIIRFSEAIPIPCSCFGELYKLSFPYIMLIDFGIILASGYLLNGCSKGNKQK